MEDQKQRQVEYHERVHYRPDRPRQVDNSHPYVEWLNNYRMRSAVRMMGASIAGKKVLSVCGGDGQEADYLQQLGADVTVVDLSPVAMQAAGLRNPWLHCLCMDAETLAFADDSFDWVLVRDGLHHLARPLKGFYEIERVGREGFIVLEGQDSIPVRLLSRLGIAENWDPAGGYVYRFSRREIRKVLSSLQTVRSWQVQTAWLPFGADILEHVPAFRQFVYPLMKPAAMQRLLNAQSVRKSFRLGFDVAESMLGRWGNSLIIVGRK